MCVLETSWRNSEYSLKTLGTLENVSGLGEGPLDVINAIDVAQVCEKCFRDSDLLLISVACSLVLYGTDYYCSNICVCGWILKLLSLNSIVTGQFHVPFVREK